MQRLRLTFAKTAAMKYTGHLDTHLAWERTFRRARLPLAYSQGFHPQPRIQLAAALPLGFTSECEVADVWLESAHPPAEVRAALEVAAPPGLQIVAVAEAPLDARPLQILVRSADYGVVLKSPWSPEAVEAAIAGLLARTEVPRVRRDKAYDLRPLIEALERERSAAEGHTLRMRLAAREGATGRPEEVVEALGADPAEARYHRRRLIFAGAGDF
jgi:radical SAM-linked protein